MKNNKVIKMKAKKNTRKARLKAIFILVSICFLIIIKQLIDIQILDKLNLKEYALNQWTKAMDSTPLRGVIMDCERKAMAVNMPVATIWSVPFREEKLKNMKPEDRDKEIKKHDSNLDAVCSAFCETLGLKNEEIKEKLKSKKRLKIINEIDVDKLKQILNKLSKASYYSIIEIEYKEKRYYPFDDDASQIIGFNNIDNQGINGLELYYNNELEGISTKVITKVDALRGAPLPNEEEKVIEGREAYDEILNINQKVQSEAEKIADKGMKDNNAKGVTIIIMDPMDGSIKAMANTGRFNLNNPRQKPDDIDDEKWQSMTNEEKTVIWNERWRNRAISDVYEPGSVFKTITLASALEENKVNESSTFYCNGAITDIKGVILRCAENRKHGLQTITQALNNSCNVAFVQIGRLLGKENFLKYIKAFGFGEKTGIDLPGEGIGIVPQSLKFIGPAELATMSYGHGIAVTPIQMITAVSSLVNGGYLYEPRIVSFASSKDGEVKNQKNKKIRRTVISKETSDEMKVLLENVVKNGTVKKARIDGYRIGGKTGTAQKIVDGKYKKDAYISSFIGVLPADKPRFVVLTLVDEPGNGVNFGSLVAAPIFKDMAEFLIKYYNIEKSENYKDLNESVEIVTMPNVVGKTLQEAGVILKDCGINYELQNGKYSDKSKVLEQSISPGEKVSEGAVVTIRASESDVNKVLVPDFVGMDINEAQEFAKRVNLQVVLEKSEKYENKKSSNYIKKIESQSIEPYTEVEEGSTIILIYNNKKKGW